MNDAIKKFEAQMRKTQRMLAALATLEVREDMRAREETRGITKAIDRCYTLLNKIDYFDRTRAELDAWHERINGLLHDLVAAHDALQARIVSFRSARIQELEIERARAANARPY
jgi:hypothetical protein